MDHVCLPVAHAGAVIADGRLHGDDGEELHEVVLEHVPQRPRLLVILAPMLHPQRLRRRDLHVVYIAPVPDGFDDGVGEAEGQDVLDGLFAQVVVNAVDLLFRKNLVQGVIERAGGGKVSTERLLHHDARPDRTLRRLGGDQSVLAQAHGDVAVEAWRRGQIEEAVVRASALLLLLFQKGAQLLIAVGRFEVGGDIMQALREPFPNLRIESARLLALLHRLAHSLAERVVVHGGDGKPDDGELRGQQLRAGQVVERGDQLAPGQVAGSAEDDKGDGLLQSLQMRAIRLRSGGQGRYVGTLGCHRSG